jgi:predicted RNA-binding protein with RPS1 domain
VTNVVDFGAFIWLDLGVEGLVHVSELADPPPSDPKELVKRGDELVLRILRIDSFQERIALSLRQVSEEACNEWLSRQSDSLTASPDQGTSPLPGSEGGAMLPASEATQTPPTGFEPPEEETLPAESAPASASQPESEDFWISLTEDETGEKAG